MTTFLSTNQIKNHITGPSIDIDYYRKYGDVLPANGLLVYQDNGADVLAVAHLDYVKWNKPRLHTHHITQCPQLDDRLGVATILEWLPKLGKFDVLLCDKEEIGQTTANDFKPNKHYRYAVEFDRQGSDCVFYQYGKEDMEYCFKEAGWDVGYGSFSDISALDHLECQCVNIGIGYHGQHTDKCYADLSEVNTQLTKFAVWYNYYGHLSFPYEPKPQQFNYRGWLNDDDYLRDFRVP